MFAIKDSLKPGARRVVVLQSHVAKDGHVTVRDKQVWINGERVRDVTVHPMFKPLVDVRARIYDMAHDPAHAAAIGPATHQVVLDLLASGALSGGDTGLFRPIVDDRLGPDPYMLLADYDDYMKTQANVDLLWQDREAWARKAILNVAGMGVFSADRAICSRPSYSAKSIFDLPTTSPIAVCATKATIRSGLRTLKR